MIEQKDYSIFKDKKVVLIVESGSDRPFKYEGLINSVGENLLLFFDDKEGEIGIPLNKILLIKAKEVMYGKH